MPIGGRIEGSRATLRWEVAYEIDWANQGAPDRDLTDGGGAYVSGGVSWNPEHMDNATSANVIDGVGLKIVPSGGSFWTTGIDAPWVHAFVIDGSAPDPEHGQLVSGGKPYDVISFQYLLTVNTDISVSGHAVGLATGKSTGANYLTLCRAHDGTANRTAFRGQDASGSDSYYVTTVTPKTFHEINVFPGGTMSAYATTDTDFADPLTRQSDFKSAGQVSGTAVYPSTDFDIFGSSGATWRLWLYAAGAGSYTFTKFRVLKGLWS